jgi:hypothetical protein
VHRGLSDNDSTMGTKQGHDVGILGCWISLVDKVGSDSSLESFNINLVYMGQ